MKSSIWKHQYGDVVYKTLAISKNGNYKTFSFWQKGREVKMFPILAPEDRTKLAQSIRNWKAKAKQSLGS